MKELDRDPLDQTPKQVTDLLGEWGKRGARFHHRIIIKDTEGTVTSGFADESVELPPNVEIVEFYNLGDPVGEPYKGSGIGEGKLFQDVHVHGRSLTTASIGTTQGPIVGVPGVSGLIAVRQVEVKPAPSPTLPRVKAPPGSTNCNPYEV